MFLLELPHRGDSGESTQHTIINIEKKITLNYRVSQKNVDLFENAITRSFMDETFKNFLYL